MSKPKCIKTQFEKIVLCAGAMTEVVAIYRREIQGTQPGLSIQAEPKFTLVIQYPGTFEAVKDTPRWNGVSVEDQSALNFTHAAYIPFDQDVYELDINTFFVKITRTRDRYFKLKGIMDWGEQEEYLQLKLAETGFVDLKATHG